ncbi:MAG: NAD(P)H-dependent oxidoreductase subunit E [Spirochaetes bacterium]|nr:NAD(P)H-dependent oxidoreductase subunit E [Spirochaetota bacterium]
MSQTQKSVIAGIVKKYNKARHRLMDIARDVQAQYGCISDESAKTIADELGIPFVEVIDMVSFYYFLSREQKGKSVIRLSDSVVDRMSGNREVAKAFEKAAGIPFGGTTADGAITLEYTSDIGMCDQAPAALVNGMVMTKLCPEDVPRIVDGLKKGKPPGEKAKDGVRPDARVDLNLIQPGEVIFSPVERGAAVRAMANLSPEEVIDTVTKSGLRGRGGAGFPTGMKWSFCRKAKGEQHYVICNADEGEPGTFKDRVVLTEVPDLLFAGMTIAGYAIGAAEGVLYLRGEYGYLLSYLEQVLARRRHLGLLGENIAGKEGFDFDIRIQMGAGAYVCGEESSLIESLEGKRGAPRDRPPYPVTKGYMNQPSAVNNVETLCCVARILEKGADWFKAIGTKDSTGTKLLSVSGDCKRPGVYEVEFGLLVDELLDLVGADDAQAVQIGGPSGSCIAPKDFGRKICFEDLPTGGSVIVFGKNRDMLEIVREFTEFFIEESCGWCAPCRVGTTLLKLMLEKVIEGRGTKADLADLENIGETIKAMSRCGLGQTAANPVLTTLKNMPEIYRARLKAEEFVPPFQIDKALADGIAIAGREPVWEEEL